MAKLLSEQELADGLRSLPGWSGDTAHLIRTLPVAAAEQDEAERAVQKLGDRHDHHAVVERAPDGLRLKLWTHSAGGVTARDLRLAAALDELLGGQSAGGGSTTEPSSASGQNGL